MKIYLPKIIFRLWFYWTLSSQNGFQYEQKYRVVRVLTFLISLWKRIDNLRLLQLFLDWLPRSLDLTIVDFLNVYIYVFIFNIDVNLKRTYYWRETSLDTAEFISKIKQFIYWTMYVSVDVYQFE